MASIEVRTGLKKTSYRVVWLHDGVKRSTTCDTRDQAEKYIRVLEAAGGNKGKADQAMISASSTAPLLSEVAER